MFRPDWLAKYAEKYDHFDKLPLSAIIFPGSHDSGTYELYPELGFAPDRPDMRGNTVQAFLARIFPNFVRNLIFRFSKTQTFTVYDQLRLGVRYLDLRLAFNSEDGSIRICHNLYGNELDQIMNEIQRFMSENPKEIVILDFQHFHNFTNNDAHETTLKSIERHIQKTISGEEKLAELTLEKIWRGDARAIVIYRSEAVQRNSFVCPTRTLPNPWPNTRDVSTLECHIRSAPFLRSPDVLFVTQCVLTPNTLYVITHFYSSLVSLAHRANNVLVHLIGGGYFDDCCGQSGTGPNIMMVDFITEDLIEKILQLNKTVVKNFNSKALVRNNFKQFDFSTEKELSKLPLLAQSQNNVNNIHT